MSYSARERFWLGLCAAAGLLGLNGVFLWAAAARPDLLMDAFRNPVSAAFIAEALVLVGLLAYLLARWKVTRIHWGWFVLLSLAGSIAFALPVVLLWGGGDQSGDRSEPRASR